MRVGLGIRVGKVQPPKLSSFLRLSSNCQHSNSCLPGGTPEKASTRRNGGTGGTKGGAATQLQVSGKNQIHPSAASFPQCWRFWFSCRAEASALAKLIANCEG